MAIQIERFVVNMIEENAYLLYDDSREAVMIDCGAFYDEDKEAISTFIESKGLNLRRLLNTHAHFDHLFGADYIYNKYGVKVEVSEEEENTYKQAALQLKLFMHRDIPLLLPPLGPSFHDCDRIRTGNMELEVIATPGHSPGGVCFYCESERLLFSGDSLFRGSIGRCDLPGGNEGQLLTALKERVLALPDDVKVYPGHGESTTIGAERTGNAYLL